MSGKNAQTWFTDPSARRVSTRFDDRETSASRRLNAALLVALEPNAETVLDIGCGGGEMLQDVRRLAPCCRLVGVDPVGEAVADARARHADDDRAVFLEGSAEGLPELPSTPDAIVSHLNLGLWADPHAGLRSLIASLAPHGLLYIVDVAAADTPRQRDAFLALAHDDAERAYLSDQLTAALSPAELSQLLHDAADEAGRACEIHIGRGGLAGYPFEDARAAGLYGHPAVREALGGFAGFGAAVDTVMTAVVRAR